MWPWTTKPVLIVLDLDLDLDLNTRLSIVSNFENWDVYNIWKLNE